MSKLIISICTLSIFWSTSALSADALNTQREAEFIQFVSSFHVPLNSIREIKLFQKAYPTVNSWMNRVESNLVRIGGSAATLMIQSDGSGLVLSCSHCLPSLTESKRRGRDNLEVSKLVPGQITDEGIFISDLAASLGTSPYLAKNIFIPNYIPPYERNSIDPFLAYKDIPVRLDFSISLMPQKEVERLISDLNARKLSIPSRLGSCEVHPNEWVMVLGFPSECGNVTGPHFTIGKARLIDENHLNQILFEGSDAFALDGARSCVGFSGGGVFNIAGELCGIMVRQNIVLPFSKIVEQLKSKSILSKILNDFPRGSAARSLKQ